MTCDAETIRYVASVFGFALFVPATIFAFFAGIALLVRAVGEDHNDD